MTRFALLLAAVTLTGCDANPAGAMVSAVMVAIAVGCRGYQPA